MRYLLFILGGILLMACTEGRARKKPPVPFSPNELVTGCYRIVDDTTALRRSLIERDSTKIHYIDPKPIVTVGEFEDVELREENGQLCLNIRLNEKGTEAFAAATRACKGRRLAFVIRDGLVMAPQVYEEVTGGSFTISGIYDKEMLSHYLEVIQFEMYQ